MLLKKFFEKNPKIFGVFFKRQYCPAKRGKHHQLSNEKGGENVEPNRRELMDIMMPGIDGLEATRQIRALDREDAATTPIIAVSANAFADDRRLSREAGMDAHLSKPVSSQELVEALAHIAADAS